MEYFIQAVSIIALAAINGFYLACEAEALELSRESMQLPENLANSSFDMAINGGEYSGAEYGMSSTRNLDRIQIGARNILSRSDIEHLNRHPGRVRLCVARYSGLSLRRSVMLSVWSSQPSICDVMHLSVFTSRQLTMHAPRLLYAPQPSLPLALPPDMHGSHLRSGTLVYRPIPQVSDMYRSAQSTRLSSGPPSLNTPSDPLVSLSTRSSQPMEFCSRRRRQQLGSAHVAIDGESKGRYRPRAHRSLALGRVIDIGRPAQSWGQSSRRKPARAPSVHPSASLSKRPARHQVATKGYSNMRQLSPRVRERWQPASHLVM